MGVESVQPLLDGFFVVVHPSGGFCAAEQSFNEGLLRGVKEQDDLDGSDFLLEQYSLFFFAGVPVDEETFGGGEVLQHGFFEEVEDHFEWYQFAAFHDSGEFFAARRTAAYL